MAEKDKRLPKQLGDFGEQLVMFILGRLYNQRVAFVDHVGADLIAQDGEKRFAVSVKSRVISETEGDGQPFNEDQQNKLRDFAVGFGLTPAVAFVFIQPISIENDFNIDVYIIELEKLDKLANSVKGIRKGNNNTIHFSNAPSNQKILQKRDDIKFQRMVVKSGTK